MIVDSRDYEWAGKSLVKLLNKTPPDGPSRLLYLLQEWNRPSEVLELINSLHDCGVLITLGERKDAEKRRQVLAKNAEKARKAKGAKTK